MSNTFSLVVRGVPITLLALTPRHHYRLRSAEVTLKPPEVPSGYDHEKAYANVESYKAEYDRHLQFIEIERLILEIGSCRQAFTSQRPEQAQAERPAIERLVKQLSMKPFDDIEEPLALGYAIADVYNDGTGKILDLGEFELWAELTAGGVDPAKVAEEIKMLRDHSQRDASREGDRDSVSAGEAQTSQPARDQGQPSARPGKGRQGMGRARSRKPERRTESQDAGIATG